MAMLVDTFSMWDFEPPPARMGLLARRLVTATGAEKVLASRVLRGWENMGGSISVDLLDFLRAVISVFSEKVADEEDEATPSIDSIEIEGIDAPSGGDHWSLIDAQALLGLGLPSLSLAPRITPRPRAALC
ncbi:MAG: hypothetical protein K6360_09315 [Deltaproteobacteria bacterium]